MRKFISRQLHFRLRLLITLNEQNQPNKRTQSTSSVNSSGNQSKHKYNLDYDYLCDPTNTECIAKLIKYRKNRGDIYRVLELNEQLKSITLDAQGRQSLEEELEREALKIPNKASPHLWQYGDDPKVVELVNPRPRHPFPPKEFGVLAQRLNVLRTENLGNVTGTRSYFLMGGLAELEQALIRYSVSHLLKCGFTLMSVPDLLYADIIEDCGMTTTSDNSQVYQILDPPEGVCLAGTAEMSLGGYLRNRRLKLSDLPLKLAAVSRCYRSEASGAHEERGIFRVHAFTKVEMFGVTGAESGEESHRLYTEMTDIQRHLFSNLGIHFQILDMPLSDLGAPAYTKTDMEAWMPGREMYGEVSSASNCIDYQARRLNITYTAHDGTQRLAHTVNGTACAVPRMAIALCETFQTSHGTITLPPALHPFFLGGATTITQAPLCRMTWIKDKAYQGTIVE